MNKFIILAFVATLAAGEAPPHVGLTDFSHDGGDNGGSGLNEYVDEALLERVAELISRGGDGSGTRQSNEGRTLDADILTRVSSSLSEGASSGPRPVYGPPSKTAPPAELGEPEPVERIAEFELNDESDSHDQEQGGYSQGPSHGPSPAPSYGAPFQGGRPLGPSGPARGPSSSGAISLGRPMSAQRVADFSLSGDTASVPSESSGYN